MKKYITGFLSIVFAFGITALAVAYQRGILMNTDPSGYYQEILPIGPEGTFLMSDPTSKSGMSWQYLPTPPISPFIIQSVAVDKNNSSTYIVGLNNGYQIATDTILQKVSTSVQPIQITPD